ncbi:MAG: hypothetical protein AAFO15_00660 [Pseudomonadota bacterium]
MSDELISKKEVKENTNIENSNVSVVGENISEEMSKLDIKLEDGWLWRLLKVKSGKEFQVQTYLEERFSDAIAAVFVPFQMSSMKRSGKFIEYKKVIHPGYIYCLCKQYGYHEALKNTSKHLEILLYVVSNNVSLEQIRNMCNNVHNKVNDSLFSEGDSVLILSGIWKDFSGTVVSVNHTNVKVQLDNFNKTFAECDINDLKFNNEGVK